MGDVTRGAVGKCGGRQSVAKRTERVTAGNKTRWQTFLLTPMTPTGVGSAAAPSSSTTANTKPLQVETGATGLEPATSGVTGLFQ